MAGAGYKLFNTGDVLTAAQVNTYLMEQTVMRFATTAARDTALSGVLAEGMLCYIDADNNIYKYTGSAWVNIDSTGGGSPLTTKGDLYTYSTTDARLAVGNNGETLVADSSASTGLRWQGNFAVGKNKIINGDFGIWQRGTTWTDPAFGTYTSDRYYVGSDGTGSKTFSRQTFTAGTAPVSGYEGTYFFRANQTTAGSGGSYSIFGQKIEDVRTFAGQTVTLSFWAKSAGTSSFAATLRQDFGSGGSSVVDTTIIASTATTTGWVRYTGTVSVPSISGKTIGTGSSLTVIFSLPINTTYTLDFWGIQLEAGNTATAFQTATGTLAGELAACQRYYVRMWGGGTPAYNSWGAGGTTDATEAYIHMQYPVMMRTVPTLTTTGTASDYRIRSNAAFVCTSVPTTFHPGILTTELTLVTSGGGMTAGRAIVLDANNNVNAFLAFSAEL